MCIINTMLACLIIDGTGIGVSTAIFILPSSAFIKAEVHRALVEPFVVQQIPEKEVEILQSVRINILCV